MVEYSVPDDVPVHSISFSDLPRDWASRETHTQRLGDAWLDGCAALILVVPSAIMPIASAPDRNVPINRRHSAIAGITVTAITPFTFDPSGSSVRRTLLFPLSNIAQTLSVKRDYRLSSGGLS
jgi:RES domain-containing protein